MLSALASVTPVAPYRSKLVSWVMVESMEMSVMLPLYWIPRFVRFLQCSIPERLVIEPLSSKNVVSTERSSSVISPEGFEIAVLMADSRLESGNVTITCVDVGVTVIVEVADAVAVKVAVGVDVGVIDDVESIVAVSVAVGVLAVSYTHLTLPTN